MIAFLLAQAIDVLIVTIPVEQKPHGRVTQVMVRETQNGRTMRTYYEYHCSTGQARIWQRQGEDLITGQLIDEMTLDTPFGYAPDRVRSYGSAECASGRTR